MIRTLSGWQHDGEPCEGRFFRTDRACRHIQEATRKMSENTSRALVTGAVGQALQLEAFASDALTQRDMVSLQTASIDVVAKWCYSFNQGEGLVTGLSIKGVQAIAREMAKKGEIIKPVDIQVVAEDDDEIRVICTAVREIIRVVDGVVIRVELDRTTRGKRQPKMQELNVYAGEGQNRRKTGTRLAPDKFWYEKAISKAVRNAMGPLMGGEMEATVISLWRQAQVQLGANQRFLPAARPEARQLQGSQGQQQQSPPPSQPPAAARSAPPAAAPPPAMPSDEADAMVMTPALRQQVNKKFNEVKTSLSGSDQTAFFNRFYAAFPVCKPLQGAPGGLVLGKVGTIGEGKAIYRWLSAYIDGPQEDELEGAGTDAVARGQTNEAVLEAGCEHPDEALQAHPEKADTYVCGQCGEEVAISQ